MRFLITAVFVYHLLLAPPLVTSQLPLQCPPPVTDSKSDKADICALSQEKDGPVYKLHGRERIHYKNLDLWADETTYNDDTGDATIEGHVILDGGPNDEHIVASHGTYNVSTDTGRFYDVVGTIGVRQRPRRLILLSSNSFAFTGKVVDKTGPDHYVVHNGSVTTCKLPRPKWQFNAHRVTVNVDGNAHIFRSTFRVRGVPALYLPFATHPVKHLERQSGFLMPSIGTSSIRGTTFGEGFYWAINRSMDATIGGQYFSKRGSAQHGEFRVKPSEGSFLHLTYYGVIDRGIGTPRVSQGGEDIRLWGEDRFADNFRGVLNIDYLSSYLFRLAFNEVFTQAIYSEVRSQGFLSLARNGYSYGALVDRYQNFESIIQGDVITILHAPSFEVSSVERQVSGSPFYWSFDTALDGLSRSEPPAGGASTGVPGFRTAPVVGRFDFSPKVSLPLLLRGWSLRPQVGVRDTFYTQRLIPSGGLGLVSNDPINRRALETSLEVRPPSLERIFNRGLFGRRLKHAVEPRLIYRRVTGVNNLPDILRFDARDILSDTNEVEYAVINRLYAKKPAPNEEHCHAGDTSSGTLSSSQQAIALSQQEPPHSPTAPCPSASPARELVSWELAQKYFLDPTFGGALVKERQNVFTTTVDFTAIAFLTAPRHLSPLVSRFHIGPSANLEAGWDFDYDFKISRISASNTFLNYRIGQISFGGSDAYLKTPGEVLVSNNILAPSNFHQFRVQLTYGSAAKRGASGTTVFGYDVNQRILQYSGVQASYNWDCCGLSVEFRRFALGSVRNENQYRFQFSLANIGSFGTLQRRERLY